MEHARSQIERFVSAVHRRMVVLRIVERLGMGVVLGCAAALLTVPVLLWRGQGAWNVIGMMLGLGALAGLLAGVIKRPTRLAAAMEADRQLKLADLLGTAISIDEGSSDFELTVLSLAGARCAAVSPSAVLVNKLGPRSWGGIALALALVSALGLMGRQDRVSAGAPSATAKSWIEIEQERANAARASSTPDTRRAPQGIGGDDADPIQAAVNAAAANATKAAGDNTGAGNSGEGTGTGASQSNPGAGNERAATIIGGNNDAANGAEASGGSGVGTPTTGVGKTGMGTGADKSRPVPPWRSEGWAGAQSAADEAIRAGKVSAAHRAIVRDYFDR